MTILPAITLSDAQLSRTLSLLFPDPSAQTRSTQAGDNPSRSSFPPHLLGDVFAAAVDEHALPVGAILAECLPGASANIWGPRVEPGSDRLMIEDRLLDQALKHLRSKRVRIVQAFRQLNDDPSPLLRFGMTRITSVWTMRRDGRMPPLDRAVRTPLRFVDQRGGVSDDFRRALLRSFENSLDCPELNGIRTPQQTVDGHLASAPDLSRWWMAYRENESVGQLILAESGAPGLLEISYLGVLPDWRGQGIGRALMDFTLKKTADFDADGLTLLVDERNRPAINLYAEFGFRMVDARNLFLRLLQLT